MRHFQPLSLNPFYLAGNEPQAFRFRRFLAGVKKYLQAEADAEKRLSPRSKIPDRADKTARGDRAREIARGMDYSGFFDGKVFGEFANVYRFGDWALFAKIAESFRGLAWFRDPGRYRGYLFSLVATGRGGEVARKADEFFANDAASQKPSVKPFDRVRFEMLKALAEGKDLVPVAKAAKLDIKEYAQALQIAAQWALNLQRNDECERYSAAYRALFKEAPERRYAVKYFDSPVSSIAAWRGVADSLEKSYVDVKMCGELDSLETDVATGRTEIEKTALDSKDARMEVSSWRTASRAASARSAISRRARASRTSASAPRRRRASGSCSTRHIQAPMPREWSTTTRGVRSRSARRLRSRTETTCSW